MKVQIDSDKWKFDPKFWAAVLAFLGFANAGDLLSWVRGTFFGIQSAAVQEESRQRRAGDSALLARIEADGRRDSAGLSRIEQGLEKVQDGLLKVPQVEKYFREKDSQDSLRRLEDRRRRRMFGEPGSREARGPWHPDREVR